MLFAILHFFKEPIAKIVHITVSAKSLCAQREGRNNIVLNR